MNEIAKAPQLRTVISTEQIQKRVREMGRQISDDYRGKDVVLVSILKGALPFLADLMRQMPIPLALDFLEPGRDAPAGLGDAETSAAIPCDRASWT